MKAFKFAVQVFGITAGFYISAVVLLSLGPS